MAADENGISVSDSLSRTEMAWAAFEKASQTHNLFLLHLPNKTAVPIPKRAFSSSEAAAAFWTLAQRQIVPAVGGFPVIASQG